MAPYQKKPRNCVEQKLNTAEVPTVPPAWITDSFLFFETESHYIFQAHLELMARTDFAVLGEPVMCSLFDSRIKPGPRGEDKAINSNSEDRFTKRNRAVSLSNYVTLGKFPSHKPQFPVHKRR